jgi:myosin heavy chain 6/7
LTLDAREIPRAYFIGVLDIAGFEIFDVCATVTSIPNIHAYIL